MTPINDRRALSDDERAAVELLVRATEPPPITNGPAELPTVMARASQSHILFPGRDGSFDDRIVTRLVELWAPDSTGHMRRIGEHLLGIQSDGAEWTARALHLRAPARLADRVVLHAITTFAAADVARVVAEGSPPGGHWAWANRLGWSATTSAEQIASAFRSAATVWIDQGRSVGAVDDAIDRLNTKVPRLPGTALRRQGSSVEFSPSGGRSEQRFWSHAIGRFEPADMAALGPNRDGAFGRAVLAEMGSYAAERNLTGLTARLARDVERARSMPKGVMAR